MMKNCSFKKCISKLLFQKKCLNIAPSKNAFQKNISKLLPQKIAAFQNCYKLSIGNKNQNPVALKTLDM